MIQQYIEKRLRDEYEENKREGSGLFVASYLGFCYRRQFKRRRKDLKTIAPDTKGLARMAMGRNTHTFVQSYLPEAKCEVKIKSKEGDIMGYCDIETEDCAYDIKGCDEWQYRKYWKIPTGKLIDTKYNNWLQVGWYGIELNKKYVSLLPWIFGTFSYYEHKIFTLDIKAKVEHELGVLRALWAKGELPEAKPRAFGGKECTYCEYRDQCEKEG